MTSLTKLKVDTKRTNFDVFKLFKTKLKVTSRPSIYKMKLYFKVYLYVIIKASIYKCWWGKLIFKFEQNVLKLIVDII